MLSFIDLTSLNESDTTETIAALCEKAVTAKEHVAAICVYPKFISEVKKILPSITIAVVANFPHGNDPLDQVITQIKKSIRDGATEIDVVFPYQQFLRGEKEAAYDFIRACKAACGESVLLKVILETGALSDPSIIAEVSYNLCHAGADFLKTSTGKIAVGATLEAARVMLEAIKKIPREIGFKASGGIRSQEQAEQYIHLAKEIMGQNWVTPNHFRIGTSKIL